MKLILPIGEFLSIKPCLIFVLILGSSRVACILARILREAEVVEIFSFETLDFINYDDSLFHSNKC